MPKIDEQIIDRITATARIEDVVEDFLGTYSGGNTSGLKRKGPRFVALCPFHDDHHLGNFVVHPRTNTFKCFACEAKGGVVDFVMRYANLSFPDAIRWLANKYHIDLNDNTPMTDINIQHRQREPLPTFIVPRQLVTQRIGHLQHDALAQWLRSLPWDGAQRKRLGEVFHDYCVGHVSIADTWHHTRHEFTAFWQIDAEGNPRTAHYMKYKPNGHRMKKEDDDYTTDWFHSLLSRPRVKLDDYGTPLRDASGQVIKYQPFRNIFDDTKQEARLCLFGEHLLSRYPDAAVNIVESEKTALIMATAYGNNDQSLWLACCGASNLTRERLAPLIYQDRRIVLYPDRDGIDLWKQKAEWLNYDKVTVNTQAVKDWWQPGDGEKADIADVVIRILTEHEGKPATVKELANRNPYVNNLIDKLNLEQYDQQQG